MWQIKKLFSGILSKIPKQSVIGMRTNYTISPSNLKEFSEPETYKEAVSTLGMLQIKPRECAETNNLKDTWKYLYRSGITARDLDALSVIHVAGTKGKSSVCTITESILRSFGCKTGLFSSPHFLSITERYRINGLPVTEKYFTKMFWKLYNTLDQHKEYNADMPTLFKFLMILSFHIFFDKNVDVAIIEAGMGGLYDCTNIIRNAQTIGITSVGMDHSNILGRNLHAVATHKAGVIKQNSNVFLEPMQEKVYDIFEEKAEAANANLFTVPDIQAYQFPRLPAQTLFGDQLQNHNHSLGIQLAIDWLRKHAPDLVKNIKSSIDPESSRKIVRALDSCQWPGISQVAKAGNKTVFMNGADSLSSIRDSLDWFRQLTDFSNKYRCLLFNSTPHIDSKPTLLAIANSLNFETALFVPDIHYHSMDQQIDYERIWAMGVEQIETAESNAKNWAQISNMPSNNIKHFTSVLDAFLYLDKFYPEIDFDILVTGSMSVVGAARRALDRYQILIL